MSEIGRAVELLRAGGIVAFPTETVYGLGADASNPAAIAKIFAAKGRPQDRPLAVLLPGIDDVIRWGRDIPDIFRELARKFWPGPLTIVLRRAPGLNDALTAGRDTVGLRIPDHPDALALLKAFGAGIAATSANRSGHASLTTAQRVREELGCAVPMILGGAPCTLGVESTVLDLSGLPVAGPRILRPGAISAEAIAAVLGETPMM